MTGMSLEGIEGLRGLRLKGGRRRGETQARALVQGSVRDSISGSIEIVIRGAALVLARGVSGVPAAALFMALVLAVSAGMGVARAADAGGAAAAALTPQQQRGQTVYEIKCLPCHGPGVWGTNALARRMDPGKAELAKRTDLNAVMVKTLMRTGIGSMPPIRKTEVTDADADAIAAYLTRNSKP